jgi:hypothetical protein
MAGMADGLLAGLLASAKKSDIIRLKIQHCELIQKAILEQRAKVYQFFAVIFADMLCLNASLVEFIYRVLA